MTTTTNSFTASGGDPDGLAPFPSMVAVIRTGER